MMSDSNLDSFRAVFRQSNAIERTFSQSDNVGKSFPESGVIQDTIMRLERFLTLIFISDVNLSFLDETDVILMSESETTGFSTFITLFTDFTDFFIDFAINFTPF
jgi:hypothetical protein